MLCRPSEGFGFALSRAGGIQVGQHCVPHMEFGALVGNGVAPGPDVQPQGVGAHQCPGVPLGAGPRGGLQRTAQGKGKKQTKAEQRHLAAGECSG